MPVPDAEPRVLDVVIVAWTGAREHVRACLASLREHPLRSGAMAVHVVDNASADGTSDMVRADFPEVELEALGWNSGFCVANNLVLRRTAAPYVLLLNPDTICRRAPWTTWSRSWTTTRRSAWPAAGSRSRTGPSTTRPSARSRRR